MQQVNTLNILSLAADRPPIICWTREVPIKIMLIREILVREITNQERYESILQKKLIIRQITKQEY